jgi:hypothetical protein
MQSSLLLFLNDFALTLWKLSRFFLAWQVVLVGGPIGSGGRGVALALAAALEACAMPAKVLHLADFVNDPPPPRGFAPVNDESGGGEDEGGEAGGQGNPALRRLERSVAAASAAFAAAAAASATGAPNSHGSHGHSSGGSMGMSIDTTALATVVAQALASASATGLRCLIIEGVAALDPAVRVLQKAVHMSC